MVQAERDERTDVHVTPQVSRELAVSRLRDFPRIGADPDVAVKRAAVCLTVVQPPEQGAELSLVLTRRLPTLRAHSGQWALPGGRLDPGETAREAASRELTEEVGLTPGVDAIVGLLDDYVTRSGYCITPVVVWAAADAYVATPNASEVASVHLIPLSGIDGEPWFVTIPESPKPVIRMPMGDSFIHAPTGAILYQFREVVLHGRTTRVDEFEEPVFAWR